MHLLTFYADNTLKLGVKDDAGIIDVAAMAAATGQANLPATPEAFYAAGLANLPILRDAVAALPKQANAAWRLAEADLRLGPPVPQPGKILCVGLNYRSHAAESAMAPPAEPILFSKFNNALTATDAAIPLLPDVTQYDYEGEMVAVIGRTTRHVTPENALDHVLGYCNGNDVSARDLQFRSGQWLLGKTPDGFFPTGPYLVSADTIPDPQNLTIRTWVNGELRQSSNTRHMLFGVAAIISYVSQFMTLYSGDLISTGTPEGVILGMAEKNWLRAGDRVTVAVEALGTLSNHLAAPA